MRNLQFYVSGKRPIKQVLWNVITHPGPNFNGVLDDLPLKLDIDELLYPPFYVNAITYPYPNPDDGLVNLCW